MIRRMPTEVDGRPVHLKTIDADIDPAALSKTAWDAILANVEIGIWKRLKPTMEMGYGPLDKAYQALYMRIYTRGLDEVLSVKTTEEDGVCFCWMKDYTDEAVQARMNKLRDTRLKKKLKLNKKRLKRIKSVDKA